jgi:Animal haem peroxidase
MEAHTKPHAARDHCLAPSRVVDAPIHGGRYGRMFPDLPALESSDEQLKVVGSAGGPCADCAGDDARTAGGWPHLGQFLAHDITADRSPLTHSADADHLQNFRTPRADLDCLYGDGPVGSPYLFDRSDPAKLLLGEHAGDVPRNSQGVALIGDPRNDVHLFVNQLHVAMISLHNLLVDRLRDDGVGEAEVGEEARRALAWHYQWVILREFLPELIGAELAAELLESGPTVYRHDGEPYIPLEFADAAYRYGHSQIRIGYRVKRGGEELPLFPDLIGFRPVPPERVLDWSLMFDLPGGEPAQRSKRIDGTLPACLIELPVEIAGEGGDPAYHSLATRDLQRGQGTGLPSGEAVAGALGVEPLSGDEVGLGAHGWEGETPLWYYVLREADVRADGDRLGPVGGRIVGETLVAIVDGDPTSYRSVDPGWRPTLPAESPERFGIADLLQAAPGR